MAKSKEDVVQEFRVQSIQEAAIRVISRKGMAAATMQEIAEEAGVAKGTIYLYFRDREELVEKTFETAIGELHKRLDAALESDGTFEERLRAVMTAQLGFFNENREFFRLYHSLRMPEGTPAQQRRQKRTCQPQFRARVDRLAHILKQAMDAGEVRPLDPKRLALFLIEGSTAIVLERLSEDAPPPESEDVELIVSTLLERHRHPEIETELTLKRAVVTLMLLAAPLSVRAQTKLTLQEALARALQVNNTVERSRVEVNVAEQNRKQLLSSILPQVNLTGSTIENSKEVSFGSGADARTILPANDWNYRVVLSQPIYAGLREKRAYDQAKIGIVNARAGSARHRRRHPPSRRLQLPRRGQRRGEHRHRAAQHRARREDEKRNRPRSIRPAK